MKGNRIFKLVTLAVLTFFVFTLSIVSPAFALIDPQPTLCTFSPLGMDEKLYLGYVSGDVTPQIGMMTFDGSQWDPIPDPVSEPQTAPFGPSLTINPEPYICPKLIMVTTINPEPYIMPNFMMREYDGAAWTEPTLISEFTNCINPSVVYFTGEVFLFWDDGNATYPRIFGAAYNGTSWYTTFEFDLGEKPTATVFNDELYVVWMRNMTLAYRIFNGTSWSDDNPRGLIDPQPTPIDPHIAVHNGRLHLTYQSTAGPETVYLQAFEVAAGWSDAYPLETPEPDPQDPAICSFDGQLCLFYASKKEVYFQAVEELGGEWSDPTKVPIGVSVEIDIKPASWPNPLALALGRRAVLPVAVCGTEDFDVTTIDPETVQLTLEALGVGVSPLRWSIEDVATPYVGEPGNGHDYGADGYLDLTLKFKTQEVIETLGLDDFSNRDVVILMLTGNLKAEYDGTPIYGEDCIVILDP